MKTKKIALVIAIITAISLMFVACDQSGEYDNENDDDKVNAEESSYTITLKSEEYAGVTYDFPSVEGMINKSKQRDINGHLKRLAMEAAIDKGSGTRAPISDTYEVLITNEKILSVIFPTTIDYDMPTRTFNILIEHSKLLFSIENLFGRAENNDMFSDMRAVFEEAGADSAMSDEDFRKAKIYFEGEDMTNLHMTYFTDDAYDIEVAFNDVYPFLIDSVSEMFDFTL
jgi:hypothetical protein